MLDKSNLWSIIKSNSLKIKQTVDVEIKIKDALTESWDC